jgi:hypothetical protein
MTKQVFGSSPNQCIKKFQVRSNSNQKYGDKSKYTEIHTINILTNVIAPLMQIHGFIRLTEREQPN